MTREINYQHAYDALSDAEKIKLDAQVKKLVAKLDCSKVDALEILAQLGILLVRKGVSK